MLTLVSCIVILLIGWWIGNSRGRPVFGVILTLLFGPFGWLIVFLSRDNKTNCPSCGERIFRTATICPSCRNRVTPQPAGFEWGLAFALLLVVAIGAWGYMQYQREERMELAKRVAAAQQAEQDEKARQVQDQAATQAQQDADSKEMARQRETLATQTRQQEHVAFVRRMQSGQVMVPLLKAIEVKGQYGTVTINPGTMVTVVGMEGGSLQIRQGSQDISIPMDYADTSSFR